MRVMFADDDKKRYGRFRSGMIGVVVDWAETPRQAIDFLSSRTPYDAVFLDYDFDEGHTGVNGHGTDIVQHIAENAATFGNTYFLIHSLNFEGRARMAAKLCEAGLRTSVVPFAWQSMTPETLSGLLGREE
jgi:hypothetical protein